MTATNDIPLGPDGKIQFADADNKKRGCLKYVLIAIVVLGLLIGGCTFVVFKGTEKAEKKAREFTEAVLANDIDKAYDLTSSNFKEATPKAGLAELAGRLNAIVGDGSLKVTGRGIAKSTGNQTTSTITYTAQKDGRKVYLRVFLVDAGKQGWRVVNFESSDTPFTDTDS
jgi:type II secretory pathway pseudopilin PulG